MFRNTLVVHAFQVSVANLQVIAATLIMELQNFEAHRRLPAARLGAHMPLAALHVRVHPTLLARRKYLGARAARLQAVQTILARHVLLLIARASLAKLARLVGAAARSTDQLAFTRPVRIASASTTHIHDLVALARLTPRLDTVGVISGTYMVLRRAQVASLREHLFASVADTLERRLTQPVRIGSATTTDGHELVALGRLTRRLDAVGVACGAHMELRRAQVASALEKLLAHRYELAVLPARRVTQRPIHHTCAADVFALVRPMWVPARIAQCKLCTHHRDCHRHQRERDHENRASRHHRSLCDTV